jgi:hypothetical protein
MAGTKHLFPVSYHCSARPRIFRAQLAVRVQVLRADRRLEERRSMKMEDPATRAKERRRAPRYQYQASLEIEWGSARLKGRTRDISAGGMFIESEDVLWVGAGFRACLVAERALWLDCSVKRVEPGYGMGVTFALHENQSQQHFADLLSKLSSPA